MYYVDFENHITNKYGVICENWPLTKFISPGNIGSRIELETLLHAWQSGATSFRRLTPTELTAWKTARAAAAVAQVTVSTPVNGAGITSVVAPESLASTSATPTSADTLIGSALSTTVGAESSASTSTATTASPIINGDVGSCMTAVFTLGPESLIAKPPKKPRRPRADKGGKHAKPTKKGAKKGSTRQAASE